MFRSYNFYSRLLAFQLTLSFFTCLTVHAQNPRNNRPVPGKSYTNISVHDPVIMQQGDTWHLFCTGMGIVHWSSKDRVNWTYERSIFDSAPAWAVAAVPGFKNHIWAPDISYHNGKYYLYYSISAFGKNTSCIGLATNTTLNTQDENYAWTDHEKVIQSYPGKDNWNAIDPNLITDKDGTPFLTFGSFWDGLKLVKLTDDRLKPAEDLATIPTIATRKSSSSSNNPPALANFPADAGGNAIEAPFIFKKGKYYYLFASIDYCCQGEKSTYKMIVGRAKNLRGPYLDSQGKSMANGGGTLLLKGDKNWHGVGHNAVFSDSKTDYLLFHGYDASDRGKPKIRIEPIAWSKKGWPQMKE